MKFEEFLRLNSARDELVKWLSNYEWHVALSMNFRSEVTEQAAIRAAQLFWNKLDYEVWGRNAVQRKDKRLKRVCFLEGEQGSRNFHLHCALQLPGADSDCRLDTDTSTDATKFAAYVQERWEAEALSGRYSMAEVIYEADGWLGYICKEHNAGVAGLQTAMTTLH